MKRKLLLSIGAMVLVIALRGMESASVEVTADGLVKRAKELILEGKEHEAKEKLSAASVLGNAEAEFMLGNSYYYSGNLLDASRLLESASNKGYAAARLVEPLLQTRKDDRMARGGQEEKVAAIVPQAQQSGTKSDLNNANAVIEHAASQGNVQDQFNLGLHYESEGNLVKAKEWLEKAALQEHSGAYHYLGLIY